MLTKDMDVNDSSPSDICTTSALETIRKPSVEEANCTNSNGDSGYHSDLSGYHKDDDFNRLSEENGLEERTSMQSVKSGSEIRKIVSNPKIPSYESCEKCCASGNAIYSSMKDYEVTSKLCNCHSDATLQNVGANDAYPSCSSMYLSRGTANGNPVTRNLHRAPVSSTAGGTCTHKDGTLPETICSHLAPNYLLSKSERKTEEWKAVQELAVKIEFCLMFGYTSSQIRAAITKLSYKASKNDILAELSPVQTAMAQSTLTIMTSFEDSPYDSIGEKSDDAISKGIDDLQPRGPLSIENENKDGINDRNSIDDSKNLRPVVIDGSNVAMSHGNKQYFSCKGILLAVDYFRKRNHRDITVFVPTYRKESARSDAVLKDREILDKLEEERILVYTPSRHVNGKRITCYDDRFILRLAEETEGIIVSNDNFRDLQNEKPEWKELVENRLLMYSFASDRFMPPDDPLGRNGPNIDNFLRKRPASEEQSKPQCPYGKKCTYGKKCKYFHPECSRPISERIKKNSEKRLLTSRESFELAIELYNRANVHNTSAADKSFPKQEDANLGQENKAFLSNRWEQEGNEVHKRNNGNLTSEPQIFTRNHRSNQRQGPPCSTVTQSNFHPHLTPYGSHPINLPEAFRQMTVSNHYPMQPNHALPCGHPNNQVCYDAHCQQRYQLLNKAARIGYPASPYVQTEHGPPDFHVESSVKNAPVNQPYQRSSPANLQIFERNNGGNAPMLQHQHVNLPGPYPSVPDFRAYGLSNPMYSSGYREPHYQNNQHLMHSYPIAPNGSHGNPPMHPNLMPPSSYFIRHINSSAGSSNSLSHSYPFVSPEKMVSPPMSQRNLSSSSNASDPKTYPPRAPRGYPSGQHQDQHLRQAAFVNSSFAGSEISGGHSGRMHAGEPPLSHVSNPRHNLFKNLCSLFQRHIVEAVMTANPDVSEPKQIIQMCLESN